MPWTPDTLKEYLDKRIEALHDLATTLDRWIHDKLEHTLVWTDESRRKLDTLPTRDETNRVTRDLFQMIEDIRARVQRMEGTQLGRSGTIATLIAVATIVAGLVVGLLHILFSK